MYTYDWYQTLNKVLSVIPFYGRMTEFEKGWEGIPIHLASKRLDRYRDGEKLDGE